MLLVNEWMEIRVIANVVLGGVPFLPSDNPRAQKTSDPSGNEWLISDALGAAVCKVDWSQLEQAKKDGFIDFEGPE